MPRTRVRSLWLVVPAMQAAMFVVGTARADTDIHPAGGELVVVSDSDCPSADAVRDALAGLRPVKQWPAVWVEIRAFPQMLVVEIGPQKTNLRQLAVGSDCATRAATVALVIATWTGDLPVAAVGTPILRNFAPIPQPSVGEKTEKANPKIDPGQSEIGVGLLATTGGGMVPGMRLEFGWMRHGSGLGWRADITVPAAREVVVGSSATRWTRIAAGVGLDGRWARPRFFLDGELGGVVALTCAWGRGYAANQSDWSPTWGLAAGTRAGLPWGRARLWMSLRVVKWLREQTVQIDPLTSGTASTADLPSWDAQGAIGIGLVF